MRSIKALSPRLLRAATALKRRIRAFDADPGEPGVLYLGDSERSREWRWWSAARPPEFGKVWFSLPMLSAHLLIFGTTRRGTGSFWDKLSLQGSQSSVVRPSGVLFNERVEGATSQKGWELSADETLDERHPMLIQAFTNACDYWERSVEGGSERERELDRLALQIARRLRGLSSEAPEATWFDGMFEPEGCWPLLRIRTKVQMEALDIEAQMGSAPRAPSVTRRAL